MDETPRQVGLRLYREAREAVVFVRPRLSEGVGTPSGVPNEAESRRKAGQRARTMVRRYCKGNGISRLWSLTYRDADLPPARAEAMRQGAEFVARLRERFGPMPYVLVPETGTRSGRLHLHFGTNRWLPKEVVAELWGHGYVDARSLGPDNQSADRCAHYLSKYVGKSFEDSTFMRGGRYAGMTVIHAPREKGEHRYEVAQGYQPTAIEAEGKTAEELLALVVSMMGPSSSTWCSSSSPDWYGPPVWVLMWDEP